MSMGGPIVAVWEEEHVFTDGRSKNWCMKVSPKIYQWIYHTIKLYQSLEYTQRHLYL